MVFYALGLYRDLGFLRGHQGHRPPDEDNEVEDNNKEEENNKDDNDDKGISALVLDRDLGVYARTSRALSS